MSSAPGAMETASTPMDTALLVSITVLQGLTFLKAVSVLVKYANEVWSTTSACKSCRSFCKWIGQLLCPAQNQKVIEKFHAAQCTMLIRALQVTMAMACLRYVFAQHFLFAGLRPPVQDLDMALVVVHVIGLFLTEFPALVTPRSLDLWYMLLQGLLVAPFFYVNLPPNAIALSNWTFVLRVMFGISARRGYLAVLVNAVVSLQVMRIVGYSFTNQFFTGEVTKLTFYILLVFAVRRLIFRDSKASVELKSRSIELEAVSALLRGFCDAVVEVDQSLHITENSNQLLTLLLRSSNQACLAGKDFIELFCSDDQQQVRECLTKFSETHTHALNARLLDADGNHVKIELLHIRFLSATGDLHRLVGVREFQDMQDMNTYLPQSSPVHYYTETTIGEEHMPGSPSLLFDIGSFLILEANHALHTLIAKCTGVSMKLSAMKISDLSPDLNFAKLSLQIQDLVNSQAYESMENVTVEMDLGEVVLFGSMQVLARVSVQYEPMLENLVGTLFLSPTGIPALTKANIDLLQKDNVHNVHGNPRSQRRVSGRSQRSHRSRSSHSSAGGGSGSGYILDLHRTIAL